ncbi:uL15m family ribosomal protein [Halosimplex aquaticum]|uniref:Large ribosomal subunit protein uL15 n=1 Tax=Halosimplex aquaticum TaxID=3026162 RepID=A0ABD5XVU1_9EURY|nr:uL15 family ribosomal protein [Halosimplex aquaticum]
MTSKKKRQRGSRTHGGGSHKNRRGAGHRGGRGNAGSRKHEMHNHGPWDKHGFKRPDDVQDDVETIDVRELDEDAALLAADGVADEEGDGYAIDARDVVEDGHEVDVVKVLGSGQVRNELHLVADDFSDAAEEKVEAAGGSVELTEAGQVRAEQTDKDTPDEEDDS